MHKKRDQIQSLRSINIQGKEKTEAHTVDHEGRGETVECAVVEIKQKSRSKRMEGLRRTCLGL